jgi:excisionase family DNA binding protein
MEQLLTPEEVSKVLQIPVKTLYRWRYRGTGPPGFRLGRHVRYRVRDVEEYLAVLVSDRGD